MKEFSILNLRESIKNTGYNIRYFGNDFYVYDIYYHSLITYPFKIPFYSCWICLSGEADGIIDLIPYHLQRYSMAVNVPEQLLEQHTVSKDFHAVGIIMSHKFMTELGLPYSFKIDRMVRDNPIIELIPNQFDAMLSYCSMVKKLLEIKRPFQLETLQHLTCAFFYGIGSYLFQISERRISSNKEILMYKFLNEVKTNYRKERKVSFYANRLNLTANYLSTSIRRFSGKTPGEWIEGFIAEEARALLKSTNLTIQQISYRLGFPTQSFFGKFFKRVVGLSPKEYREKT